MLKLSFRSGEVAFVFHNGHPIGAVLVGEEQPNGRKPRIAVVFGGDKLSFEIVRASVIEERYGREVLEGLVRQFLS